MKWLSSSIHLLSRQIFVKRHLRHQTQLCVLTDETIYDSSESSETEQQTEKQACGLTSVLVLKSVVWTTEDTHTP